MMATRNALLVTPYPEFGAIVSQSLGSGAATSVKVATSVSSAQALLQNGTPYQIALLDLELGIAQVLEQGQMLRSKFPSIELVLISRKEPPAELAALQPWKLLTKPFRPRELSMLFGHSESIIDEADCIDLDPGRAQGSMPAWLGQGERTQATLASAVANLSVQEAVLFSNQEILAQSGNLTVDAFEEFSSVVRTVLNDRETLEVIKPVHLTCSSRNLLLLTSILAMGVILAVAYDEDTPYNLVRSQTRRLTQVLKNPQLTLEEIPALGEPHPAVTEQLDPAAPVPSGENPRRVWKYSRELTPAAVPVSDGPAVSLPQPATQALTDSLRSLGSVERIAPVAPTPIPATRQSSFCLGQNEPSVPGVDFACALVPRMINHHLAGDLSNFLLGDLPNLFLAHGWRLEALEIEDAYLQWLARIPPTVAPATHIKIVRNYTSQRILTSFARLERSELLQDFWAPGYLLGAGKQLLQPQEITEFIRANRLQYYSEETVGNVVSPALHTTH